MKRPLLIGFGCRVLLTLLLATQGAGAVILFGSGDPAYNTTPPTGALTNSGWQYEGQWGSFLGTPIAPHYFLAARHVGGDVGQPFVFRGVSYTTTACWDDPASDLRIWQISGSFPAYAPLYASGDETGRPLVVFGRGTQRGSPVTVSGTQTAGTSGLVGWQDGPGDGVMRWGQNQVRSTFWSLMIVAFTGTQGTNEAYLSGGDSSGAVFIQDDAGVWKLAGINYAVDGPFATSATGTPFYGAIFNEAGLYVNGAPVSADGGPQPANFYSTRVSTELAWIQSVVGTIPAAPPELEIQFSAGYVLLSFPTNAVGYTLQSSPLLGSSAGWQAVTNPGVISGANWNVTLPATAASAFFRLQSAH